MKERNFKILVECRPWGFFLSNLATNVVLVFLIFLLYHVVVLESLLRSSMIQMVEYLALLLELTFWNVLIWFKLLILNETVIAFINCVHMGV